MTTLARSRIQAELTRFSTAWHELEKARKSHLGSRERLLFLLGDYDRLTSRLYRARIELNENDPLLRRLEEFMAGVSEEILALQPPVPTRRGYLEWRSRYRMLWRRHHLLFFFAAGLFLGSIFLGWNLVANDPSYAAAVVPQNMLENVLDRTRWFESLRKNPIVDGLQIAINNIRVSFLCFLFGSLFALGGLWLLAQNGILIGAIMAFCYVHDFHQALIDFIIGHGPLELSIIVASAFAGFLIGRAFYVRPFSGVSQRLAQAGSDGLCIVMGVVPWLTLAAFIEAFISPWMGIDPAIKLGLGLATASLFWGWTFWPEVRVKDSATPAATHRALPRR